MDRSVVAGVVLAAGESARFGQAPPKLLLDFGGRPLIRRVVEAAVASRLTQVVVVLGAAAEAVGEAIGDLSVELIECRSYRDGQSSSVAAGLARVGREAGAAMFLPGDQPFLDEETLNRLIAAYQQTDASIVVPAFGDRRGAPVLFDRRHFGRLAALQGDEGGRQLLRDGAARVLEVQMASELPLMDVDSPEDYLRLRALLPR